MVWMSLTCVGICSAQVKEKVYQEISVIGIRVYVPMDTAQFQTIDRLEIAELQPNDLGDLLFKFAGTSIKNYGGPGSLKTLNFRGLGGQHTRVLIDGFESSDAQSGQLNFGQVPTTNIESVHLDRAHVQFDLTPSSMIGGQILTLQTNLGRFPDKKIKTKLQSAFGSFGLIDQSALLGLRKGRFGLQAFGRIRKYNGEYPFKVRSGGFTFEGIRAPTHLNELYGGVGLHWHQKGGGKSRLIYKNTTIDQKLPGSIVLYNNYSNQFLASHKHQVSIDQQWKKGNWSLRPFLNVQIQELEYVDEHYQNIQGFLRDRYQQFGLYSGWMTSASFQKGKIRLHGGVEHKFDHLVFQELANKVVQRHQLVGVEELGLNWKNQGIKLKLGLNTVQDISMELNKTSIKTLPNAGISWMGKRKADSKMQVEVGSDWSYRLPSFNELYFGSVGSPNLLPENAYQNRAGLGYRHQSKRSTIELKTIGYVNWVENKIVAIPTKNLFVWSIQNVDKVRIVGGDIRFEGEQKWTQNMRSKFSGTYSFQKAQNRTQGSISFNDQIAYIPSHSGNADLSVYYKHFGTRISSFWTGMRYALNQNNALNQIRGFNLFDWTVFYDWTMKKQQVLRFQLVVKNWTNQSVEFVRGFTMPGRNFLISITYEI